MTTPLPESPEWRRDIGSEVLKRLGQVDVHAPSMIANGMSFVPSDAGGHPGERVTQVIFIGTRHRQHPVDNPVEGLPSFNNKFDPEPA